MYPLQGEEILLFKTSISFIDHLQECPLVIPPFSELKDNMFSVVDFLQVCFHIEDSTIYRTYNSRIFFFIAHL
jgi:hypothetical protein